MYKILFVCTGNICRSPTAEGVMRFHVEKNGLASRVQIDSAGTTGFHAGDAPDMRSVAAAKKRGVMIDGLRARQIGEKDFDDFDLILALDQEHLNFLRRKKPADSRAEVALFLEYAGVAKTSEVPDPYYGDAHHFEYVLDLIEAGVKPLMDKLQQQLR